MLTKLNFDQFDDIPVTYFEELIAELQLNVVTASPRSSALILALLLRCLVQYFPKIPLQRSDKGEWAHLAL